MGPLDVPIVGFFVTPRILGQTLTTNAFLPHCTYGAIGHHLPMSYELIDSPTRGATAILPLNVFLRTGVTSGGGREGVCVGLY